MVIIAPIRWILMLGLNKPPGGALKLNSKVDKDVLPRHLVSVDSA